MERKKTRVSCEECGEGGYGRVVTPPTHGENTRNSPVTEPGGRHRRRGPEIYVVSFPRVLK